MKNEHVERFEHALFRLAVYQAAAKESAALMEEAQAYSDLAPTELDVRRFKKKAERHFRRKSARAAGRRLGRISGRVAVVLLVIVLISMIMIATVEAFRNRFINFLLRFDDRYTQIRLDDTDALGNPISGGGTLQLLNGYMPKYIPEGYVLKEMSETDLFVSLKYANDDGGEILFRKMDKDMQTNMDTEGAQTEIINISGNFGILSTKNDVVTITWSNEEYNFVIVSQASVEATVKMAKSVELE